MPKILHCPGTTIGIKLSIPNAPRLLTVIQPPSKSVGDNLLLHIYGIDVSARPERYEWDMISTHLAGCIIPYHWFVRRSFETAQVIIDFLYGKYDVPFVIAADTGSRPIPAPSLFHTSGISLSGDSKLVFWRADDAKSVRRVYTTLFDSLIDRTAQTYD